ncbi:ubiquitin carboxyl-terminal hydrolase 21 isoform X2 [Hippocampus zosterae]|uniref:ubiquitin carboxyl-terminal hydrolase 21 isoform X2 n=1 Tax=Hippocampus zosterae TaxID=109293 RepID=UPI00223D66FD|nr:ubiquitin carboxyl-terminal hydrolase 21 isoform X2 [Hippocampus zosterae]
MPGADGTNQEGSCKALCRNLVSQNGLQRETADISQSVLYTSLMGLLLVADNEKELLALGSGRAGLRNIGNTVSEEFSSLSIIWGQHGYSAVWLQCFLNAIVQCLSHTRGLRDYCLLKSYKHDKFSKEEPRLTEAFAQVLSGLWDSKEEDTVVNPRQFYNIFRDTVPYFSGYSQQDAQEFLRFLLEKLHTEINRKPYNRRPLKDPEQKYARFRISEEAAATWKKHLDNDDSKIVDLFSGQLRSSLHCSVCSHYSNTFDVFCDLSLPIPKRCTAGEVTLKECLDLFSQEEKLDKDNSPMCERCNRHTESTKRLSIQRFPNVIVIHLNRFTTSRWSISKSTTYVSFPLTNLDLGPYGPIDCGAVLYDLYAICNHVGAVNMGHYTACCSDENGWCYYNDSSVSAISETQLQTNQAYVLFYQRSNNAITTRK